MRHTVTAILGLCTCLAAACQPQRPTPVADAETGARQPLPQFAGDDFADARRGLLAPYEPTTAEDQAIASSGAYAFVTGEAPATVHPSLWRQARLTGIQGLFQVAEGIYQVRGLDLSNLTIIQGAQGWILVDPLTTRETGHRAWSFVRKHLPERPITAVIYTHSHVDHFGGMLGVLDAAQSVATDLRILAPEGFDNHATEENILAGPVMRRRAGYMYGMHLPRSAEGHVDGGIGREIPQGHYGYRAPTEHIRATGETAEVDGVKFVFQMAPNSEAPAEMAFYLPEAKIFCGAELATRSMHNLYTLRGAKVRDALSWSRYLDESLQLFPQAEMFMGAHLWPMWGAQNVRDFLVRQRDMYKYIHDQTLRLAGNGLTPDRIAEQMQLPESLSRYADTQGYYGTVKHNSRAVYQYYFGWFDGNPAHLDPLPESESAARYVAAMGGADKVRELARQAAQSGDLRWAAELLNKLVFAESEHPGAREELAAVYRQLAYQATSAPWRNFYLTGAQELRAGVPEGSNSLSQARDLLTHAPMPAFLDALATRLNPEKTAGARLALCLRITDTDETYALDIENDVLHHRRASSRCPTTLSMSKDLWVKLATNSADLSSLAGGGGLDFEGSMLDAVKFLKNFDPPNLNFPIVEP